MTTYEPKYLETTEVRWSRFKNDSPNQVVYPGKKSLTIRVKIVEHGVDSEPKELASLSGGPQVWGDTVLNWRRELAQFPSPSARLTTNFEPYGRAELQATSDGKLAGNTVSAGRKFTLILDTTPHDLDAQLVAGSDHVTEGLPRSTEFYPPVVP